MNKELHGVTEYLKTIRGRIEGVFAWLKGGSYMTTTDTIRTTGPTGTDVGFRAKSSDSIGDVSLLVGIGGVNHGLYSHNLDRWIVNANSEGVYLDGADITVRQFTLTNTAHADLRVFRWGKLVTVTIINPTALVVGNNVIATLPVGYRPTYNAVLMLIAPTASGTPTNALGLRAVILPNGDVTIYNYRSSAISGNTNASGTVTFIVGG